MAQAERDALEALHRRLMKASTEIDALAMQTTNPNEKRRLEGKSEGVRLAFSYLAETLVDLGRAGSGRD